MSLPDPSTFIARGASAEVFRLGGGMVLKLFHEGVGGQIVAREYAIAQVVQEMDLPVARAIELRQEGGRQGIVYTEIEGPNLLHYMRRRPDRLVWGLGEMARLHARIHRQAAPALRSRKDVLAEDIESALIDDDRLRGAALERLEQLIEPDRLSHGDLHPANLIVTPAGLAVIDWSRAGRAAPAADVVRTEMVMRFGPGAGQGGWKATARDWAATHYIGRYRRHGRMEPESLAAWRALVALAWLRHRAPSRDSAFEAYLGEALAQAGLPPLTSEMSFADPR
ncbi:aminoglycoside phosphotransferase family protein [Sphingobium sp. AN558]|uniref:phosphotransferase family protein n=1 Tax=Sphingobium sp. AN558 TaxID=3133442 RepID=UPI0030BD9F82